MNKLNQLALIVAQIWLVVCLALPATVAAQEASAVVDVGALDRQLPLAGKVRAVESVKPAATIDLADGSSMQLQASMPASVHRWAIVSVANSAPEPRAVVLLIPHQRLIGSGLFALAPFGSRVASLATSTGVAPVRVDDVTGDAYALTLAAGAALTLAIEVNDAGIGPASVWSRAAFAAQQARSAFFNGVIFGVCVFMMLAMACLVIIRPMWAFPAGAGLAAVAIAFIALEVGYLDRFMAPAPAWPTPERIRALIEVSGLVSVIIATHTFLDLSRRSRALAGVIATMGFAAAALLIAAVIKPLVAITIARVAFVAFVVLSLVIVVVLWRRGRARARAVLPAWLALAGWTTLAGFAAAAPSASLALFPGLLAGLTLVLIVTGFCLAQIAFDQSIVSTGASGDAHRRALALIGSGQSVWDYQVETRELFVDRELEHALGYRDGEISGRGGERWLEYVHPADRSAYVAAVAAAENRARGSLHARFRLRRADGAWRWFVLRARVIIDDKGRPARLIGAMADVTGLRRSEDRLLSDAVRDRLTGLPNRALFLDRLERAMRRAAVLKNTDLYVLVVAIDRFRQFNEGLGHDVGDSVLVVLARRLKAKLAPDDTVGRLPGGKFAIVFNAARPKRDLVAFAEQVRAAMSDTIEIKPRQINLTASIGVARFDDGPATPADLVKNAEIALYEARRRGLDMIEFFSPDMRDDRGELASLEQDLRHAVERGEIEVLYQPIMHLADHELAGFEALVRWRHPHRGILSPDVFVDVAEETGLIVDIGAHVLSQAVQQLGIWQRTFARNKALFVSVNMSSTQLLGERLIEEIKQIMAREDIAPGSLKLELTESLIMQNPELSVRMLDRLRGLGLGLSCDDFGTGHSSLAWLRNLPFDTLKIDRAFIEADREDERASVILESIVFLAQDLGLTVVAEGIETPAQLERVRELECDFAQGFHIGQPVAARQVIEVLGGSAHAVTGGPGAVAALWRRLAQLGEVRRQEDESAHERAVAIAAAQQQAREDWASGEASARTPAGGLPWPPKPAGDEPGKEARSTGDGGEVESDSEPPASLQEQAERPVEPTTAADADADKPTKADEPAAPPIGAAPLAPRRPRAGKAADQQANGGGEAEDTDDQANAAGRTSANASTNGAGEEAAGNDDVGDDPPATKTGRALPAKLKKAARRRHAKDAGANKA